MMVVVCFVCVAALIRRFAGISIGVWVWAWVCEEGKRKTRMGVSLCLFVCLWEMDGWMEDGWRMDGWMDGRKREGGRGIHSKLLGIVRYIKGNMTWNHKSGQDETDNRSPSNAFPILISMGREEEEEGGGRARQRARPLIHPPPHRPGEGPVWWSGGRWAFVIASHWAITMRRRGSEASRPADHGLRWGRRAQNRPRTPQ